MSTLTILPVMLKAAFSTCSAVAPSVRSTASSKARALAEKAVLEAKAATLRQIHDSQLQELKLQQRKAELELQGEIAKVDAETRVYEPPTQKASFNAVGAKFRPHSGSTNPF